MSAVLLRVIGAGVLAASLFAAGWAVNGWRKDAEIAGIESDRARERQGQALAQMKAVDDARIEEQRRTAAQTEIANAAKNDADTARADARTADAAAGRLRQRVAGLVAASRTPGNSATAGSGPAAGDPLDVLTIMFSRLDRRAGELAEYADAARIAGQACERAYDSLTIGAAK